MSIRSVARAVILALVAVPCAPIPAAEWPSWRGPHQNGVSDETGLISSWSVDGENLAWKAELIGRSTPVVFDGRVCATGRVGEGIEKQELVACYDAENGGKLWEHRFNVFHTTLPFSRVGWTKPAADPETGNLYVQGVAGLLMAFDRDGDLLWERSLTEEFGRFSGYGGRTHSPVVDEDRVVLSMTTVSWGDRTVPKHRYFAFDKHDGELIWIADVAGPARTKTTYSTPVVAVIGGQRLLIGGNSDGAIYAIQSRTGEPVWKFQLSKLGLNTSVAVVGDRVYASTGDEPPDEAVMGRVVCIDATGEGDVTDTHEVWRAPAIKAKYASPLIHDGITYIVDDSANLHALDATSGQELWVHTLGTVGRGSPVWADGKLYVTEVNGHFHILRPSRDGVEVLDEELLAVEDGRYAEIYGSPAIAYGRVYFTTEGGIYALGDPKVKFHATRGTVPDLSDGKPARSDKPARIILTPAEALTTPDRGVMFTAYAFDEMGRPLGRVKRAKWAVLGLDAEADMGRVTPDPRAGGQAGRVAVKLDDLTAIARLRVVPTIPWEENFDDIEQGKNPSWFVGAGSRFKVEEKDGEKVLAKPYVGKGLERQIAFMGASGLSGYSIQTDLMGTKKGRRMPDMGLVAGRYIMDMQGNHQRLQIRDWAEQPYAKTIPFPWEPGVWYTMKMRVDLVEGGKAIVRGKVWTRGDAEPDQWTITAEDPVANPTGSPGLYGYSPTTIYYDNVKVTESE